MPKFLYGTELNLQIENMILNADEFLFLISPYIKLHEKIKEQLRGKISNDKLAIVIVFGKNEADRSKSLSTADLNFLKTFPNIQICYVKNLHAKYYASEDSSLITSLNLHEFSQNTNVEVGVQMFPKSLINALADKINQRGDCDSDSIEYFAKIIENSEKIFIKEPRYETGFLKKTYIDSVIKVDNTERFFNLAKASIGAAKTEKDFTEIKKNLNNDQFSKPGYCIRTGVQIPFNPEKPLSNEAYRTWIKFADKNYPEKFCHYSGESSHGETCVSRPVLRKNWKESKNQNA